MREITWVLVLAGVLAGCGDDAVSSTSASGSGAAAGAAGMGGSPSDEGGGGQGAEGGGGGTPAFFGVTGTVSGLKGSLVVQNNGGDDQVIGFNGNFVFPTLIEEGASYDVSVLTQPGVQSCVVENGSGTISGPVTDVTITCDDLLFFFADDGATGLELWKSDGTEAGTMMVKDINAGAGSSGAESLTSYVVLDSGVMVVAANDGMNGKELWASDGTAAGTTLIDINLGSNEGDPLELLGAGAVAYFSANGGASGRELYQTDGTAAGTVLVKDILQRGLIDSNPQLGALLAGEMLFGASTTPASGVELWKTDGTELGTTQVLELGSGEDVSGFLGQPIAFGGKVFFRGNDGFTGAELFASDGTALGTQLIKDVSSGASDGVANVPFVVGGGTLFFSASDGTNGTELWKSDGTTNGTVMVADVHQTGSSFPRVLGWVGGKLFLEANDGSTGSEPFVSDGTAGGTVLLADIIAGTVSSNPSLPYELASTVVFSANDGGVGGGRELFRTDLTTAGTVKIELNPSGRGVVSTLGVFRGELLFIGTDGSSGDELCKSDGTAPGTVIVKDICPGSCSSGVSD